MKTRGILVKRSNCLVFFFQDGTLHCKNYLTGREFEASPLLVPILEKLDRWRTFAGDRALLPEYSPASIRAKLLPTHCKYRRVGQREFAVKARICTVSLAGVGCGGSLLPLCHQEHSHCSDNIDEARFNRALKRREPPPPSVKRYLTRPRVRPAGSQ